MLKFGFTILIASLPILYKMEIDKRFRLSTIYEEDYNNLNSNRISIDIIMETDGKISAIL
jgi:hypothetical protein